MHKTGLSVTLINSDTTSSMEYAEFKIANHENEQQHNLILLYRPPNTNVLQFILDLTDILESLITKSGSITLLGDFNIKVNEEDDYEFDQLCGFSQCLWFTKQSNLSNTQVR